MTLGKATRTEVLAWVMVIVLFFTPLIVNIFYKQIKTPIDVFFHMTIAALSLLFIWVVLRLTALKLIKNRPITKEFLVVTINEVPKELLSEEKEI